MRSGTAFALLLIVIGGFVAAWSKRGQPQIWQCAKKMSIGPVVLEAELLETPTAQAI